MDFIKEVRDVNLKEMVYAVMRRWRLMVAAVVLLAVMLGGFKGLTTWYDATDPVANEVAKKRYQEAMADYQIEKNSIEQSLEDVQRSIEWERSYLEKSVLMNMSPYNVYEATMSIYVSTDYQITPGGYQKPDQTAAIVEAYRTAILNEAALQAVAEALKPQPEELPQEPAEDPEQKDQLPEDEQPEQEILPVETKYLKELVTVTADTDGAQGNCLMIIKVRYSDAQGAETIIAALENILKELTPQITDGIGKHSLEVVIASSGSKVDIALADTQKQAAERLSKHLLAMEEIQNQIENLEKPTIIEPSIDGAIKGAVKYGIIGALIGLVAVAAWAILSFVAGDRVYSAREILARYQIRVLGQAALPRKRKTCRIDTWLMGLEDRAKTPVNDFTLAAAATANHCADGMRLVVTGDAPKENVEAVTQALKLEMPQVQVTSCGSLLEEAEAMRQLKACDAVVLVERCRTSRYSHMEREMTLIAGADKALLGCIVLDV